MRDQVKKNQIIDFFKVLAIVFKIAQYTFADVTAGAVFKNQLWLHHRSGDHFVQSIHTFQFMPIHGDEGNHVRHQQKTRFVALLKVNRFLYPLHGIILARDCNT
jgi:hypothetical protein